MSDRNPIRIVNSVAPIRICDNGGWTDTWFAEYGKVFNIGVYPYVEVQMQVFPYDGQEDRIVVNAENYGERYVVHPDRPGYDKHPLLEAAIDYMAVPDDVAFEVSIYSECPGGCSTGTSAAVTVALIGALDMLTPGRMTAHEVALTAQRIETEKLCLQCGIQDQLCSAYGGINYIEMFKYPHASVSQIRVADRIWWELERRLALIFLGKAHSSSEVHEKVIKELEDAGPDCPKLEALRETSTKSRDALYAGNLPGLGKAMIENTEAQAELHPDLVGEDAKEVIAIAKHYGALGWKVNGAGGEGGSITVLCGNTSTEKRMLINDVHKANRLFQNIPIYLSRYGLRVWDSPVT